MKKKFRKNNNINQTSFYFEDYLETNKKNKIFKKSNNLQDRIYLLFFFFFSLILIFSIKITHISLNKKNVFNTEEQKSQFSLLRRDIVDRNGIIISRNVNTFHAAIDPKQIKDKKNFLIKLRLNFPELPINETQLDLHYLTSPAEIEKKLSVIGSDSYQPIKYSRIFFDISDFTEIQNKISNLENIDEKKIQKK